MQVDRDTWTRMFSERNLLAGGVRCFWMSTMKALAELQAEANEKFSHWCTDHAVLN